MVKLHVVTPTIEEFISLLKKQEHIRWSKLWYIDNRTIGVYFIEIIHSYSMDSALLNIVIDHDKEEKNCKIWIEPFGTGMHSPDKSMREIIRGIGNIAMSNGWHFKRLHTTYGGDTCPHCNASYRYKSELNQHTSTRTCQNCGKQFDLDKPIEVEIERGQIRYKRTPCPWCEAAYTYRKKHMQDDNSVVCQNCGESFVLQIGDWSRYSYEWYQEDDDIYSD